MKTDLKKTVHGRRASLILCEDEDRVEETSFLYFLSPSYSETKRYNALESMVDDRRKGYLYLVLDELKETEEYKIPKYSFHHVTHADKRNNIE